MSEMSRSFDTLVAALSRGGQGDTPTSGGIQLFGVIEEDGVLLDGAEQALLPWPVLSMVEHHVGDRVSLTLIGQRPVITGVVGGSTDSTVWEVEQGLAGVGEEVADLAEQVVETSELVNAHEGKLEAAEQQIAGIKDRQDETDGLVAGLGETVDLQQGAIADAVAQAGQAISIANVSREQLAHSLDDEPPEDPVEGAVWYPRNEQGDITGMWRWTGSEWATHATLTGLLLVPTEDGGQTLIGPDGVEATKIVAELLRVDLLYFDDAAGRTLVITDIPRENLAEDVGDALATAEELGSRIILDGASGTLTIARNRLSSNDPVTAVQLSATSLDFVAADKLVAYIDSDLQQMSIANALITESFQVGAHLVRTIPGSGVTTFQQVSQVGG